jgi:hypothetical protein
MPGYKCKSIAALDIALSGLATKMRVEADAGTGVFAKTVGELRKVTTWVREFGDTAGPTTPFLGRSRPCGKPKDLLVLSLMNPASRTQNISGLSKDPHRTC